MPARRIANVAGRRENNAELMVEELIEPQRLEESEAENLANKIPVHPDEAGAAEVLLEMLATSECTICKA